MGLKRGIQGSCGVEGWNFIVGKVVLSIGASILYNLDKAWLYLEGVHFGILGSLFGLYENRQNLTNLMRELLVRLSVIS